MLVLTRKPMDGIQIGNHVVVTVLEIRGNQVRIGIDAFKEIRVLRTELLHLITESPTTYVAAAAAASTES